eukprot:CAMPEP_0184870168 /NCGR_PEP_ID=MMETSP0580-20130426/36708_1 /TAXON_ID=1118495 /ORGANISM="Dactyliosolen fragilissimus" /LENGTH=374 /DNA_ID=CAMNT_0027372125 /DNA_START=173 /DNA_END=1294 /DNA_ORIENTATION=+
MVHAIKVQQEAKVIIRPSSITIKRGSRSTDQKLKVLSTKELINQEDDWNTYIELYPNNQKFDGSFLFSCKDVIIGTPEKKVISFQLKTNIRGPSVTYQKWIFKVRNFRTKKWESLTRNKKKSWTWQVLSSKHISTNNDDEEGIHSFNDYLDGKNRMKVRLYSNNKKDNLNVDYMAIILATTTTVSPPTPLPTPSSKQLISVGDTWTYDLGGSFDIQSYNTKVVMIDLFDTTKDQIKSIQNDGRTVCCYFSAGTWESWREDKSEFPSWVIGKDMDNWDGEKWLNVDKNVVKSIMKKRIQLAADKGCNAVEPDNVDGYLHETGFSITSQISKNYLKFLSQVAHDLNLLIALKNSAEIVNAMEPLFDFAIVESCYKW